MPRPKNAAKRLSKPAATNAAQKSLFPATDLWIAILLLIGIAVVYVQVVDHEFLNYDDPLYVPGNPEVRNGLTIHGIVWAFTSAHDANWIPLTWLSHMLDCQLFGLQSGWQHLTNVILHASNSILLFIVLLHLTAARWRSAFVAFVFALHPLHVESVAWIAERKDVLSALFFLLSIWAYARYVNKPSMARYIAVAALFCCALMSKPMAVTLPIVLLLLDVWPLRRSHPVPRLVVEKVPLFVLAAATSVVAFLAQKGAGAVSNLEYVSPVFRLENAVVSYAAYLWAFVWPADLAVIYPYPTSIPAWEWIAAALGFGTATFLVLRTRSRFPYLAPGWFWYLIMLLPVIGLIQIGSQARADRYTYLPLTGIAIILAWGVPQIAGPAHRAALAAVVVAVCIAWTVVSWRNVQYWRDTVSLFQHAVESTNNNYVAYTNLGDALRSKGRTVEAVAPFENAYRIRPDNEQVINNLGAALQAAGRTSEAVEILTQAVRLFPDSYRFHVVLGHGLMLSGRSAEAEEQFNRALQLQPNGAEAHYELGGALVSRGLTEEARPHLEAGLPFLLEQARARAEDPDTHYNLGTLYGFLQRRDEAIGELREAVRLRPNDGNARFNLAVALAESGRNTEAADQFEAAAQLKPKDPNPRLLLAHTLEKLGRFDEAASEYEKLLKLDPQFEVARQRLEELRRRGRTTGRAR